MTDRWDNVTLPQATRDGTRLAADFDEFGYCVVAEALAGDNLTAEAFARQPTTAETDFAAEELAVLAELRLQPDEFLTVKEAAEWKLRIGPCPPVWRVALTMLSVLRSNGRYAGFATRAARKRSWLADHDMPRAGDLTGLQP